MTMKLGNRASDLTGLRFGSLTAIDVGRDVGTGALRWICRCDCGNMAFSPANELARGNRKACKECASENRRSVMSEYRGPRSTGYKHGQGGKTSKTKEYRAWCSMNGRCVTPSAGGFKNYGGRGISVCEDWRDDFEAFLAHIGPAPSSGHSVDRIDVNGNYEPGNVRWATRADQDLNKRGTRMVVVDGERMTITEAASREGISYMTMYMRVYKHPERYGVSK